MSFRCKLLSLDLGRCGSWQNKTIEQKADLDPFLQSSCKHCVLWKACPPPHPPTRVGEGGWFSLPRAQTRMRQAICFWFRNYLLVLTNRNSSQRKFNLSAQQLGSRYFVSSLKVLFLPRQRRAWPALTKGNTTLNILGHRAAVYSSHLLAGSWEGLFHIRRERQGFFFFKGKE